MLSDLIRYLYGYNAWANNRILDTCRRLTQEQFLAGEGYSTANPSIRDTLVHAMGAHEIWLSRWNGISPTQRLNPQDFGTVALIQQYWDELEQHTRAYLNAVEDDVLEETFSYNNLAGKPFSDVRWRSMMHQVNHATQHRAEVALLLTRFNQSPGDLDMLVYRDEKGM